MTGGGNTNSININNKSNINNSNPGSNNFFDAFSNTQSTTKNTIVGQNTNQNSSIIIIL